MKNKYTKFRVVYHKTKYLCSNRMLTDDIEKVSRFFFLRLLFCTF